MGQFLQNQQGQQGFGSQIPSGYGGFSLNPQGGTGGQGAYQQSFNLNPQGFQLDQQTPIEDPAAGGSQPWGGILGSTQWGQGISKKFGDFGKKGGLLGMAMKGMGVEGAGDMMSQFTGGMQGGGAAGGQPQYLSNVENAANMMPQAFQNQSPGSFY